MENKILAYAGIGIFVLLLVFSIIASSGILNKNSVNSNTNNALNPELEKYRSEEIPEACRLPEYENDLEEWEQHLSHHQQTLYCLDYFKNP